MCVKNKSLQRNYGISVEEYLELWKLQNGQCAVCQKALEIHIGQQGFGRGTRAELDHDHAMKKDKRFSVRGILCGGRWSGCNRKLGRHDNLAWLKKVIAYLEDPPARKLFRRL